MPMQAARRRIPAPILRATAPAVRTALVALVARLARGARRRSVGPADGSNA
ncbi:hypothetical protein [Methylobacterium nigriterrae]|uniref:hypothetical protein n=1 Tax=Methylobacterium nigriterrae TaxID=3127512 RepID=UPI003013CFE6